VPWLSCGLAWASSLPSFHGCLRPCTLHLVSSRSQRWRWVLGRASRPVPVVACRALSTLPSSSSIFIPWSPSSSSAPSMPVLVSSCPVPCLCRHGSPSFSSMRPPRLRRATYLFPPHEQCSRRRGAGGHCRRLCLAAHPRSCTVVPVIGRCPGRCPNPLSTPRTVARSGGVCVRVLSWHRLVVNTIDRS
jgi:hypothetical protein